MSIDSRLRPEEYYLHCRVIINCTYVRGLTRALRLTPGDSVSLHLLGKLQHFLGSRGIYWGAGNIGLESTFGTQYATREIYSSTGRRTQPYNLLTRPLRQRHASFTEDRCRDFGSGAPTRSIRNKCFTARYTLTAYRLIIRDV